MTFILTVATDEGIYQVSDRRLTRFTDGSLLDDDTNKAVFLDGRMTFAYTGISEIEGVATDLWLLDCFAKVSTADLHQMCERVRERADSAFSRLSATTNPNLRHMFVGVCWDVINDGPLSPLLVTIANALSDDGKWLDSPQAQFELRINQWGRVRRQADRSGTLHVAAHGVRITDREKADIWRTLRAVTKKISDPWIVVQTMMGLLDYVAKNHSAVGPGLISVYIPKVAAEQSIAGGGVGLFTGGRPSGKEPMFFEAPADVRDLTRTAPRIAIDGLTIPVFTTRPLTAAETAEATDPRNSSA